MTKLQHFYTARLLHDQPSTFFNQLLQTKITLTTKLLHDQSSTFLNNKLLHDQTSTFLNEITT